MHLRLEPTALAGAYMRVRALSEALAATLEPEDQCIQSMPDASPTKWHLAHTSWFFETFVLAGPGYARYREGWDFLFNSYYQTVGSMHARAQRGLLSRPTVAEILAYRRAVDEQVLHSLPHMSAAKRGLVELGLHHEQQHQELILTDIKHALSLNPLAPAYRDAGPTTDSVAQLPALRWVEDPGGLVAIGRATDAAGFGFDNEGPRHKQWLEPFAVASRPVSCGEYLAFMADDGYARPQLWLSEGWDAVQREGWRAPAYWRAPGQANEPWRVFTLDGLQLLDPSAPVCHVSFYEADAYARWRGARLPREAEWEHIAQALEVDGNLLPNSAPELVSAPLHPVPTPEAPSADPSGLAQMFGDTWEWTASPYQAYPGYRPPEGAIGEYNGKFMCNQLVLRGGSCATPHDHVRASYRNFFHASTRWQFSGLRLAKDLNG
ncbi:hypothetical protein DB30_05198 [Enhygromyxa salina]|uniref:Iron(II)-dependent oxidoreductase EgtB n=1 Tax=Enhygromyxa salina TaxID=215803 RepID=A0A0C2CY14_9BACT|nr:ergothioneine biosynthesis protein EgtB [Enhygromyxa salina]KIG15891.1 hypothetical protein DB30_05198 [Enhygromyxa salina]